MSGEKRQDNGVTCSPRQACVCTVVYSILSNLPHRLPVLGRVGDRRIVLQGLGCQDELSQELL